MTYPKLKPCPKCGTAGAELSVYTYEHGGRHVECEELRQANRQLAAAAICPDACQPENVRKQAAGEIVEFLSDLGLVSDASAIKAIRTRFGLEG